MKRMKMCLSLYRTCLPALIGTFFTLQSFSQKSETDSLLKKFDTYRTHHAVEKIYVHTDQELYLTGENLWFKVYLVDGTLHKPTDISKVAYLEILDNGNQPVLQAKVGLQNGSGNGSIFLPASLAAGKYTFRAYTNWMKNFGADFYFQKSITIINPFKKLELERPAKVASIDLQFFPESGNLISGIRSKIAFRAVNGSGKGIDFNGVVLNNNNDSVALFKPHRFGMGSFELTPVTGQSYRAVILDNQGQRHTYKLPDILGSGYVLKVKDSTENLLSVTISHNLQTTTAQGVYLFIHARNIVSVATRYHLARNNTVVTISRDALQDGISHITLFDSELNPVCERLYFSPVRNRLQINIRSDQREFGIRRKVAIDVNTRNTRNEPLVATVSVAVFKTDSLQQRSENNIHSYLWLDADLAGSIESPEYYTQTDNPEVRDALDLVMLTHGWRRFLWKDILTRKPPDLVYIPEFRGHIIRGQVTNSAGAPAYGITTYLASPSRNIQVYGSTSNAKGELQFEMKDFSGPRKIIVQTNTAKDSTSRIKVLNPFSELPPTLKLPLFNVSPVHEKELTARSIGMQVQDIFYMEKNFQFISPTIDTTAFYGKPDETYYLDDYTRFPVMEEVMREYVPGVLVRKRKDGFHFMTLDVVNKKVFDEDPLVLLDGIPVFDIDDIMAFDPLKVKKLEVLTRRNYNGVLSMPGIVSYTTYTGDLNGFQLDPRSVVLDYDGLQLRREFYSPKYETAKQRDSRMPDQRNLLHWAPNVITDKEGNQRLEFYSSDLTGEFTVVIEGLTKAGHSGSGSYTFSVRAYDN